MFPFENKTLTIKFNPYLVGHQLPKSGMQIKA
jgi:hypothetical protein